MAAGEGEIPFCVFLTGGAFMDMKGEDLFLTGSFRCGKSGNVGKDNRTAPQREEVYESFDIGIFLSSVYKGVGFRCSGNYLLHGF